MKALLLFADRTWKLFEVGPSDALTRTKRYGLATLCRVGTFAHAVDGEVVVYRELEGFELPATTRVDPAKVPGEELTAATLVDIYERLKEPDESANLTLKAFQTGLRASLRYRPTNRLTKLFDAKLTVRRWVAEIEVEP